METRTISILHHQSSKSAHGYQEAMGSETSQGGATAGRGSWEATMAQVSCSPEDVAINLSHCAPCPRHLWNLRIPSPEKPHFLLFVAWLGPKPMSCNCPPAQMSCMLSGTAWIKHWLPQEGRASGMTSPLPAPPVFAMLPPSPILLLRPIPFPFSLYVPCFNNFIADSDLH